MRGTNCVAMKVVKRQGRAAQQNDHIVRQAARHHENSIPANGGENSQARYETRIPGSEREPWFVKEKPGATRLLSIQFDCLHTDTNCIQWHCSCGKCHSDAITIDMHNTTEDGLSVHGTMVIVASMHK